MSPKELDYLAYSWELWARPEQLPPPGHWTTWLVLGGRGSGKSRLAAEQVRAWATTGSSPVKIALVAPTYGDARKIFIDGESGIGAIYPRDQRPRWIANKGEIQWPNGSIGWVYTCEEPERFRNPQHHYCWWDEAAASSNAQECWALLSATMRLGDNPQTILTTTPKPHPLFRALLAREDTVHTTLRTKDNPHLSPGFFRAIQDLYGQTAFAAQELDGILLGEADGALFKTAWIRRQNGPLPQVKKTIVAVDPSSSDSKAACECGIIVASLGVDNRVYLLDDASRRATPAEWIRLTDQLRVKHKAQEIVYESNYGRGFIEALYRAEAPAAAPFLRTVQATTTKAARATPAAAMVEAGRVVWTKPMPELETQITTWVPGRGKSPDRMDAMVWAVYYLALTTPSPAGTHRQALGWI